MPEEPLPGQGLWWSITFKAGHFQPKQLYTVGMGMYHRAGKLGFQLFLSESQISPAGLVCWNTCYIFKSFFLVGLTPNEVKRGRAVPAVVGQCHQPSLLPLLYQVVLLHVVPWNTSDFSASRTLCCHVPEENTNSFNTKYSLPIGSDHLISPLWKCKEIIKCCCFVPTHKTDTQQLLYPKFWSFKTLSKEKFEGKE